MTRSAGNPEPAAPAGYAGTPLAKKLGVKDDAVLVLIAAPPRWAVPELPASTKVKRVSLSPSVLAGSDVALAFCRSAADVAALTEPVESLPASGSLWVAWPRKAGGHVSDVDENLLRELLLPLGVVDVKVAALDRDWSGLKFVWRKEHRAGRPG
jgi:hypothetical protein